MKVSRYLLPYSHHPNVVRRPFTFALDICKPLYHFTTLSALSWSSSTLCTLFLSLRPFSDWFISSSRISSGSRLVRALLAPPLANLESTSCQTRIQLLPTASSPTLSSLKRSGLDPDHRHSCPRQARGLDIVDTIQSPSPSRYCLRSLNFW